MSKLILIFGSILLLTNTIVGLLLSIYLLFNWGSVDVVLIINTILLHKVANAPMNNAFKVSLSFILPFLGIVSTVLALLSPYKFKDNYCLIGLVFILFIEVSCYILAINIKSINNNK